MHDGINQACDARAVSLARQSDSGVAGGVRRDTHAQQLVRAQAQKVKH